MVNSGSLRPLEPYIPVASIRFKRTHGDLG
jgi:hypothetical protein